MKARYALTAGLVLAVSVLAGRAAVAPGAQAPAFKLTDTKGTEHALADFRGKHVVLEWTNYDCPFVRKHYDSGNMQKLQKTYTAKGIVWLSICSSAPGKQGNYPADKWNGLIAARGAAPTAVLLDPGGGVGRLYGARTTPHLFVIDPEGAVIYQGAIDDKPSANKADIEGAVNYVAGALDKALAGEAVEPAATPPYGCSVKY